MEKTKIYAQSVAIHTRVNKCENKFWVIVYTYKRLTDKTTRKKVFDFLMKEFGIEGMYGMSTDDSWLNTVYDIESIKHYNLTDNNYTFLIE